METPYLKSKENKIVNWDAISTEDIIKLANKLKASEVKV